MSTELSNGDVESSKRKRGNDWVRKRVSQACDQCRKKKFKCDGIRPICSTCVSSGRRCFYGDILKKRGLPEGYVRGLETLLGLLQSDGSTVESISALFDAALGDELAKRILIETWNGDRKATTEKLPEKWRSSKLCKALEFLLPALDIVELGGQDFKKPRMEPHAVGCGELLIRPDTPELHLPAREIAEALLTSYFTHTNSWLPIIAKDEILAYYYQTFELPENSVGQGEHALLWAVLAYSEHQKVPTAGGVQEMGRWHQSSDARAFYEKASSLIHSAGLDKQIGHVQAFLILSLIKLGLGQTRTSWLLVNQAINIAIDLGVNDISAPTSKIVEDKHRRVFLGCFYLDTILAASLGRAPRFRKEDAIQVGFIEEKGLEEWGPSNTGDHQSDGQLISTRSLSIFNHLIRLTCVLNNIAHNTSSNHGPSHLEMALHDWKCSLPVYCSISDAVADIKISGERPQLSPHLLNLRINFLLITFMYQRKYCINTNYTIAELKSLYRMAEDSQISSTIGSVLFLPAFSLIKNEFSCLFEQQWVEAPGSIAEGLTSTDRVCIAPGSFHGSVSKPGSTKILDISRIGHEHGTHLLATDPSFNAKQTNNDRPLLEATVIYPRAAMGSGSNHLGPTPRKIMVGTAGEASFANFPLDQNRGSTEGLLDIFSQLPEAIPEGTEGLAADFMLPNADFADDYFFELSNLDQFTGNQDETYRNLGFLLDSNGSDSVAHSNDWQPTNGQAGTHTPDEWSQWFGHPENPEDIQDGT